MRSKLINRSPTGISYKNFNPLMIEVMKVFADYACDVFLLNSLDVIFERNKYASGKLFRSIDYRRYVRGGTNPTVSILPKQEKLVDYWDKVNKGSSSEEGVSPSDLFQWIRNKRKYMKSPKKELSNIFHEKSKLRRTQNIDIEVNDFQYREIFEDRHGIYDLRKDPLGFYKFSAGNQIQRMSDDEAATILQDRIERGGIHSSLYAFVGIKREKSSEISDFDSFPDTFKQSMQPEYYRYHTQMSTEIRKRNKSWFRARKELVEESMNSSIFFDNNIIEQYKEAIIESFRKYSTNIIRQFYWIFRRAKIGETFLELQQQMQGGEFVPITTIRRTGRSINHALSQETRRLTNPTVSDKVDRQFRQFTDLFVGFVENRLRTVYSSGFRVKSPAKRGLENIQRLVVDALNKTSLHRDVAEAVGRIYKKYVNITSEDMAHALDGLLDFSHGDPRTPQEFYDDLPDSVKKLAKSSIDKLTKETKQELKNQIESMKNREDVVKPELVKFENKRIVGSAKSKFTTAHLKQTPKGKKMVEEYDEYIEAAKLLSEHLEDLQKDWKNIDWAQFKNMKDKHGYLPDAGKILIYEQIAAIGQKEKQKIYNLYKRNVYNGTMSVEQVQPIADMYADIAQGMAVRWNLSVIKNMCKYVGFEFVEKTINYNVYETVTGYTVDSLRKMEQYLDYCDYKKRDAVLINEIENELQDFNFRNYLNYYTSIVPLLSSQLIDSAFGLEHLNRRYTKMRRESSNVKKLSRTLRLLGGQILKKNAKQITNILKS